MDRARELAESGAPSGHVVVADYQSQGRGTHGREWLARPGTCLMFTVLARPAIPPHGLSRLPLDVGETVAGFLQDRFGLDAVVSPPNDVEIGGRKVCGILCTSRVNGDTVEWLLCGIGLNTAMWAHQLPVPEATSLAAEGVTPLPGHRVLLPELLSRLRWLLPVE